MVEQVRTFASHAVGGRLDKLIATELADLSRTQVQRLIDEGWVKLNGQVVTKAGQRLEAPAHIEVRIPPHLRAGEIRQFRGDQFVQSLPHGVRSKGADL